MEDTAKSQVRAHVKEYMDELGIIHKDTQEANGIVRGNVNSFAMSVAVLYALQEDAHARSSNTEVFELAIWYLMFAVAAVSFNIYLHNHVLSRAKLVGRSAFQAFYYIAQSVQQYYLFLLVNLAKGQVAKSVMDDSWNHYNVIPLTFTALLYYVFDEIRMNFISSSHTTIQREIRDQRRRLDSFVHTVETANN